MIYSQPQSTMTPTKPSSNIAAGSFSHAMRREIYEQPHAIAKTIEQHLKDDILFPGELDTIESALLTFEKLIIAASGSSRHAGLAGEIMIEDLSGVAVDVEYASEYCYRSTHAAVEPIVMVITQSGETADTIAAQREALTRGVKTIAISNVDATTIVREAGAALISGAGPELSIPATKSFTTQLAVLYSLSLFLARLRGRMTAQAVDARSAQLYQLPGLLEPALASWEGQIRGVRSEISERPMQILIRCDRPNVLASRVFADEQVVEAQLLPDGSGLLVKTRDADQFYRRLNQIALDGIRIEGVAPADDDVNSVYEYLIGEEGAR